MLPSPTQPLEVSMGTRWCDSSAPRGVSLGFWDSVWLEGGAAHLLDEAGVVRFGKNPWKDIKERSWNAGSVLLHISQFFPFHSATEAAQGAPGLMLLVNYSTLIAILGIRVMEMGRPPHPMDPHPMDPHPMDLHPSRPTLGKPYLRWTNRGC